MDSFPLSYNNDAVSGIPDCSWLYSNFSGNGIMVGGEAIMMKDFDKMLAGSLQLEEPWYIKGAEFRAEEGAIHVNVGIRPGARLVCPKCGKATKRYGYEPGERIWRHADCLFYPCYVHCKRPRVLCDECGIIQINAPFERKNSRFTLMFEGYAMLIMADMPRRKASRLLRCDEKSLTAILKYWVDDAVEKMDLSDVKNMAIDETSFKKGHDYATVAIDADKRRVFDVQHGRGKEAVAEVRKKLEKHGGKAENMRSVTSDMSASYLPAVKENFPEALQVVDKFHVKQIMLKALDQVRTEEQRAAEDKKTIFAYRKLFWVPEGKMTEKQRNRFQALAKSYPKTGRAFRMVQALDIVYAAETFEQAEKSFRKLYSWMRRSRLEPMKKAALTLKAHSTEILNYFHNRKTNAIAEGLNSMIQAGKRKARGFNTFEGFASMIYLIVGKLDLAVANPLS